ncbi:type II toxin-antitoxin system VapB family antitoxin [Azospirillum sp.]|uniref:type II toxin-antitoxin system VapB family antitoxin n=1 Tax=Azospirillum sp. TaxID=34012 RepID=UPI003D728EB2
MGLIINSERADQLARELAAATGESMETAVTVALAERLNRVRPVNPADRRKALEAIRMRASRLPVLDPRSDEEILGYNADGIFD